MNSHSTQRLLAALLSLAIPKQLAWAGMSAQEIAERNFVASKPIDATLNSTIHLINSSGQERVRETEGKTKLIPGTMDNRTYVNFLSPSDVRGTKTLLVEHSSREDDIWIYLPAMKKVRRLVANNKKDSFVGTDFSYGDVLGYKVEDWSYQLLKEEPVGGRNCYVIEATPKTPEVAQTNGYSRRVIWIDKESFVALRSDVYDQSGELFKKLTQEDVQNVDAQNNKWVAMRLTAENLQTKHRTVIELKNYRANVGVRDDVFTPGYLEK